MEQLVLLKRERREDKKEWLDFFLISEKGDPNSALRKAVKEFLLTDKGKQAIHDTYEEFNWGDALMYVPADIWKKHGVQLVDEGRANAFSDSVVITVSQDEVLIPDEFYEQPEEPK